MGAISHAVLLVATIGTIFISLFLTVILEGKATVNTRFKQFFPVYSQYFTNIRDSQCAGWYTLQEHDFNNQSDITGPCPELLNCILGNTSEAVKGNMTSATILLGLMPTILISLSSAITETALLAKRRPLLALILACGSPAINPIQSFSYPDPTSYLQPHPRGIYARRRLGSLRPGLAAALLCAEYLVALGALANVAETAYRAGMMTVNTVACTDDHYPALWVVFNVPIHLASVLALGLQADTAEEERDGGIGGGGGGGGGSSKKKKHGSWYSFVGRRLRGWFRDEFSLCIQQERLRMRLRDASEAFTLWWCFTSIVVVAYVAYGTVVFSSLAFIGYLDALTIMARIMASAVACRMILMFELGGMRNAGNHSGP